jgi:anti-sigma B factor antagonist
MALEIEATGDVIRLRGEVDLSTATEFFDALVVGIGEGGSVTLELSGVTFMDSTGIKALISATHHLDPDVELVLRGAPPALQRLFDLTRLGHVPGIRLEPPG